MIQGSKNAGAVKPLAGQTLQIAIRKHNWHWIKGDSESYDIAGRGGLKQQAVAERCHGIRRDLDKQCGEKLKRRRVKAGRICVGSTSGGGGLA